MIINLKKTLKREKNKINKTKKRFNPPTYFEVINNLRRYKKVNLDNINLTS